MGIWKFEEFNGLYEMKRDIIQRNRSIKKSPRHPHLAFNLTLFSIASQLDISRAPGIELTPKEKMN